MMMSLLDPHIPVLKKVVERYKKRGKGNQLGLMIIKDSIPHDLRGTISSTDNRKDYMELLEEQFKASPKVVVNSLLTELT